MKIQLRFLALIFCLPAGLLSISFAQQANKEATMLRSLLEKNHYSPRVVDDKLSKEIFNHFLTELDPHGIYFIASDLKELSAFELNIDNELQGESWKFLPLITERYKQRLLIAEKTFNGILQKPFDYSTNEVIYFTDDDSMNFAADEKAYLQRWNKWLKYKTLWQLVGLFRDSSATDKIVLSKEPQMREKVKMIEKRNVKRILEHPHGYENYIASLFFKAITFCFDPHSVYMSKTDWENFESSLSKEGFSFGIDLEENQAGDIVIARLVPGGPAWKSNELHKGDLLTEIKWEGKEPVDLAGAEVYEVEALLQSSNSSNIEITIQMANGMFKTVSLSKEKIREEENIVKSYILKGEKKIGYISLPGFYSEYENMSPLGCANDVAKEIIKLKQENIEGLILDIRYNGGGSLQEGTNLAGIFINEGPLLMMQGRDKKPIVKKDMNRGTVYDGPLVLMVNGQSASASEVLASTLQDYNRAVIVGGNTYGKASGQIVMPLDTNINLQKTSDLQSPYGVATVTVIKLYRISGKSAQLKGVPPDVQLPDIYEALDYGEASFPFSLPCDSVNKKVIYSPLQPLPIKQLSEKSIARTGSKKDFQILKSAIASQEMLGKNMKNISLNFTAFKTSILKVYKEWGLLEKTEKSNSYSVENTSNDKELLQMDTYTKEINEVLIENIKKSIYIEEAFYIVTDLITLTKN